MQTSKWTANETRDGSETVSDLSSLSSAFAVHYSPEGKIEAFYGGEDVTAATSNLNRGIASIFQYPSGMAEPKMTTVESDVTGDCSVAYIQGEENKIFRHLTLEYLLSPCQITTASR